MDPRELLTRTLEAEERVLLREIVDDVHACTVRVPEQGQDNRVTIVDERWVVRVANTDDAHEYVRNELAVLDALAPAVRAPRPVARSSTGMVYELLPGATLDRAAWRDLGKRERNGVAGDLRAVLVALHRLEVDVLRDPVEVLDEAWVRSSIARCAGVPPRAELGFDPGGLLDRFEAAWDLDARPTARIVHVDLKPSNLLVDGTRASVLDFGGLGLGDPAIDYGVLAHHFGESMLEALCVADSSLGARARCYADLYHLRRCTRGWTRSPRRSYDSGS